MKTLGAMMACAVVLAGGLARAEDRADALGSPLRAPVTDGLASPAGPPPSDASEFALDITASTVLPLAVGATVSMEVPGHVVIRAGGGVIPGAFVDAFNDVGTGWGAYDESTASVVSALLVDATVLAFGLGLRPAGTPGIELAVSYLIVWTHRVIGMQAVGFEDAGTVVGLDTTIDAIHGEVAYQTELVDHVYFRLALGWAHAVRSRVTLRSDVSDEAIRQQIAGAAATLSDVVARSAFGPTVGVSLGARF